MEFLVSRENLEKVVVLNAHNLSSLRAVAEFDSGLDEEEFSLLPRPVQEAMQPQHVSQPSLYDFLTNKVRLAIEDAELQGFADIKPLIQYAEEDVYEGLRSLDTMFSAIDLDGFVSIQEPLLEQKGNIQRAITEVSDFLSDLEAIPALSDEGKPQA